jgi:Ca-activated chloride channel family protein
MKNVVSAFLAGLLLTTMAAGDAGVLLPRDKEQPNPAILSLEEMEITIRIDNGDARIFVRQVFANHSNAIEEGNYVFALPSNATISDFATWDGPTRLPAVVLERKRAQELYNQLKQQMIDPGLLQMGERGAAEARRSSVFSAKIVPIPRFGTKRLEIEYHESIPVENLKSYFAILLRPDAYQAQTATHFSLHFELVSAHPIRGFQAPAKTYPLQIRENTPQRVVAEFAGDNVQLGEDFVVTYEQDPAAADKLEVLTYRNPVSAAPSPDEISPERSVNEPGFFEAKALIGSGRSAAEEGAGRTVVALFDVSLSMQWEKLERSYQTLETLLRGLKPADRFNVILFNAQVAPFQPAPVAAGAASVQKTLDFVRASRLRGGTDVERALAAGLAQCAAAGAGDKYLVLLSDGGATRGAIANGKLAHLYEADWNKLPASSRPRTYVLALGDDANLPLLRLLSRQDGVLEHVLSTEPMDFKLNSFLSKIGRSPLGQLRLEVSTNAAVDAVYPLQASVFAGAMASWVGRYQQPASAVAFTLHGVRSGQILSATKRVALPAQVLDHPQLPRLWARARVDALLEKIERDGEDRDSVDEIIRLARKYKLVTPYTSFLAVPRALLRPRVIRPGDPVLRVKTDESITSVVALFPFGLIQPLRYLKSEDIWQTRFLVPTDMQDGAYSVRLLLRDRAGHVYREAKTFVIASKPPTLNVKLEGKRFQRGQVLRLRVTASQSTRTLLARLEGAAPVSLRWDPEQRASAGQITIPDELPPGTYRLTVTAEDMAHNLATQEVPLEIAP